MSGARPRVSIVIPVYNGSNYLREAIDSALAQTYPDVEVLVVNDGSTDGGATEAIATSYGPRIRYVAQPNGGVAEALNTGIREMTGDYLSWLSHDDVYLPHKVASQMSALASAPEGAVLFGDYEFIDASGKVLGAKRFHGRVDAMHVELVTGDPVNGCTTLIPKKCFEIAGPFDVSLRTIQDYDLWYRLATRFPFVHVPNVVLRSRLHPEQGVRTISTHYAETVRQLSRFVEQLPEAEIRLVHAGPLSGFYARLALRMKLRGFDDVSRVALAIGRRVGAEDGSWARAQFALAAAACALLTRKLKPSYWMARVRRTRERT